MTESPSATSPFSDRALREAAAFLVLTCGLSFGIYSIVILANRRWPGVGVPTELAVLGVFAPAIVTIGLRLMWQGRSGLRRVVDQSLRWRFPKRWWVATIGLPPVLVAASYGAYLLTGGLMATPGTVTNLTESGPLAGLVILVAVMVAVILAYVEEIGWRGYLLPRLQRHFSAITASVILGVFWFGWHLPLLVIPGGENAGFPVWLWGLAIIALAIVYTWLFNVTGGSVLAVSLFHAGLNVWGRFVALHPSETGEAVSAYFLAGGQGVLALMIVLVFGWRTLAGYRESGERVTGDADTGYW